MEEETKPIIAEPTGQSLLEEAKKYANDIRVEREKIESMRNEIREIETKRILSGRSYSGQTEQIVETPDAKWAREAKIRYAGTGMDPTPKS